MCLVVYFHIMCLVVYIGEYMTFFYYFFYNIYDIQIFLIAVLGKKERRQFYIKFVYFKLYFDFNLSLLSIIQFNSMTFFFVYNE
jgi:hypothetical protein